MLVNPQGRRATVRLGFRKPRVAKFATHDIIIVDLSTSGAGIRHQAKIAPGTKGILRFRLEREHHEIECTIARSRLELVKSKDKTIQIYRSGLNFVGASGANTSIREAIKSRIQRAVARQQADAYANPHVAFAESSGAIPLDLLASWMESRPFIRCTLERGRWTQQKVDEPDQPSEGFTVSVDESPAEIQLLCKTYERANPDQRTLIRMFAMIAVTEGSDEPRGQFSP
jgi:hypothetical protein